MGQSGAESRAEDRPQAPCPAISQSISQTAGSTIGLFAAPPVPLSPTAGACPEASPPAPAVAEERDGRRRSTIRGAPGPAGSSGPSFAAHSTDGRHSRRRGMVGYAALCR